MSIVQSGLLLAIVTPFFLATWIAFLRRHRVALCQDPTAYATAETYAADPVDLGCAATAVDLCTVLRDAVVAVDYLAQSCWVRIELAVDAVMISPVDANVLRTALCDTMLTAINAAPGGQVLVTAAKFGSQVHVRITDDGPGSDQQTRWAKMRQTEAAIVSQGGAVAVEVRPGLGTTVMIDVPMPVGANQPATADQQASGLMQLPVLADQAA